MAIAPIVSPADWRGPDLIKRTDWVHQFTEEDVAEIDRALTNAKARGLSLDDVSRETFPPNGKDRRPC